jgi:hypothetical protein
VRGDNDDGSFAWMPVSDTAVAQFRRMTRGLKPIAARKLNGLGLRRATGGAGGRSRGDRRGQLDRRVG